MTTPTVAKKNLIYEGISITYDCAYEVSQPVSKNNLALDQKFGWLIGRNLTESRRDKIDCTQRTGVKWLDLNPKLIVSS